MVDNLYQSRIQRLQELEKRLNKIVSASFTTENQNIIAKLKEEILVNGFIYDQVMEDNIKNELLEYTNFGIFRFHNKLDNIFKSGFSLYYSDDLKDNLEENLNEVKDEVYNVTSTNIFGDLYSDAMIHNITKVIKKQNPNDYGFRELVAKEVKNAIQNVQKEVNSHSSLEFNKMDRYDDDFYTEIYNNNA